MLKKMLLLLFAVSVSGTLFAAKIATVNMRKVIMSSEEARLAARDLQKEMEEGNKKLEKMTKELKSLQEEYQSKSSALSSSERSKRQGEITTKQQELQQYSQEFSTYLQQQDYLINQRIFGKVGRIVKDISEAKGYDLVLQENEVFVLYADESYDITDQVVEKVNESSGSEK